MPRSTSPLPISSTQLEVDLLDTFTESVAQKIGNPIEIKHLWNADECPVDFLQHLAAAFSVDGDTAAYTETQLRNLIKISVNLHHIKGTLGSVIDVITALGYTVNQIIEGDRDSSDDVIRTDGRWGPLHRRDKRTDTHSVGLCCSESHRGNSTREPKVDAFHLHEHPTPMGRRTR